MVPPVEIKSIIFNGSPADVQEQISSFLKDRTIRIYSFVQSQSTLGETIAVTATLLYVEYAQQRKEVLGFNSPR
ncbi:MAG: hypothetical protein K0R82_1794 [Flavipsychrobacter sp.]|jgi:hypothetical protein|nr:hypothetical protein [Flavipsychrobacter sp.]